MSVALGRVTDRVEADVEASVDVYYPVPFAMAASLLAILAIGSLLVTDPARPSL